jgi:hypothetical protein
VTGAEHWALFHPALAWRFLHVAKTLAGVAGFEMVLEIVFVASAIFGRRFERVERLVL